MARFRQIRAQFNKRSNASLVSRSKFKQNRENVHIVRRKDKSAFRWVRLRRWSAIIDAEIAFVRGRIGRVGEDGTARVKRV
jgi:hypothetical protein